LTDTTMSWKSRSSRIRISSRALSTSAAAQGSPDRHAPGLRLARDGPHAVVAADVAGVEPQLVDAADERRERQPVVEVDVGDERHMNAGLDRGKSVGRRAIRHRHPRDLTPGLLERQDLGDRGVGVAGVGRRHRLDGDRGAAAHRHPSDLHPPRLGPIHRRYCSTVMLRQR
jgi:hypothetical protein